MQREDSELLEFLRSQAETISELMGLDIAEMGGDDMTDTLGAWFDDADWNSPGYRFLSVGQDATGGQFVQWVRPSAQSPHPVVLFGSEGEHGVLAASLQAFVQAIAFAPGVASGHGPASFDFDDSATLEDPDALERYRDAMETELGLAPESVTAAELDALNAEFCAWVGRVLERHRRANAAAPQQAPEEDAKLLGSATVALDAHDVLKRTLAPLFGPTDVLTFALLAAAYAYSFAYGDAAHAWRWLIATVALLSAVGLAFVFISRRRARRFPTTTFEVWSDGLTERHAPGWEETYYWEDIGGYTRARGHLLLHVHGREPVVLPAKMPADVLALISDALRGAGVPPKAPVRKGHFRTLALWVALIVVFVAALNVFGR